MRPFLSPCFRHSLFAMLSFVNSKKGVLIGIAIALILSVSAIFFLSGRYIFVPPEERTPAEEVSKGLIKSTFYKNIPRLELQFVKGTKEEEVREWLKRYDIILLQYDAETALAQITLTDPSQNITDVKEQISAEKNPNLKSITLVE